MVNMTDVQVVVVYFVALLQYLPEESQKNQEKNPVRKTDLREDISTKDLCPLSG
jgi:hypothetical protein